MPPSATSPATASNLIDEFLSGAGLTAPAVAKILSVGPRQQPTDSSVIHRWMTEGVTTSDDRRIVLESAIVGGRRLTTRPALARFILAQNGGGRMMRTPPAIEPDGRREIAPPSKPSSVTTPIPGETVKRISQARPRRPMKSAPSVGETLDSLLARMSASDNPKIAAWGAALLERGECASNLTYKAAKS